MNHVKNSFFNMRRSLVAGACAIALIAMITLMTFSFVFIYAPIARALALARLSESSQTVEERIRTVVVRVESIAKISRTWGELGVFDMSRLDSHLVAFRDLFTPLLALGPDLSSIVLADHSGHEILLRKDEENTWIARITKPESWGKQARFYYWNATGRLLRTESKPYDYDARQRPWFKEASNVKPGDAVRWTTPFVFKSTNEPGLSVVVSWMGAKGNRHYFANDLSLIDFSHFTRTLSAGTNGFVVVLGEDGRVFGLPKTSAAKTEAEIESATLKMPDELQVPALTDGFHAWMKDGRQNGKLISFPVLGTPWVAMFKKSNLGAREIWVGTLAPTADFLPPVSGYAIPFGIVAFLALLVSWFLSSRITDRLLTPLEQLADISEELSRMENSKPIEMNSSLPEIEKLANSLESIRRRLRNASQHLLDLRESQEFEGARKKKFPKQQETEQ